MENPWESLPFRLFRQPQTFQTILRSGFPRRLRHLILITRSHPPLLTIRSTDFLLISCLSLVSCNSYNEPCPRRISIGFRLLERRASESVAFPTTATASTTASAAFHESTWAASSESHSAHSRYRCSFEESRRERKNTRGRYVHRYWYGKSSGSRCIVQPPLASQPRLNFLISRRRGETQTIAGLDSRGSWKNGTRKTQGGGTRTAGNIAKASDGSEKTSRGRSESRS